MNDRDDRPQKTPGKQIGSAPERKPLAQPPNVSPGPPGSRSTSLKEALASLEEREGVNPRAHGQLAQNRESVQAIREAEAVTGQPIAQKGAGVEREEQAKTRIYGGGEQLNYHQEPVVGWLVVVGGPGLGAHRPIYLGSNTIGSGPGQRIPIDFGDEYISKEEQAYIRYDADDRQFLFIPNLAKTNVVSIDGVKPTSAVRLTPYDIISMGHTQLVFIPFCGEEFDWSDLPIKAKG